MAAGTNGDSSNRDACGTGAVAKWLQLGCVPCRTCPDRDSERIGMHKIDKKQPIKKSPGENSNDLAQQLA